MSWFAYGIAANIASALERAVDKLVIVKNSFAMTPLVASFIRNALFTIAAIAVGLTGFLGELNFFFSAVFIPMGLIHIFGSMANHYFLEHKSVTNYSSLAYLLPLAYIVFESLGFDESFSLTTILAIFLLCIGGLMLAVEDPRNLRDSSLTWREIGLLLVIFADVSLQLFFFKFLLTTELSTLPSWLFFGSESLTAINSISFWVSAWLVVSPCFLIYILPRKVERANFWAARKNYKMLTLYSFSKLMNAIGATLEVKIIVLATVSHSQAMNAFLPVFVFLAAIGFGLFGLTGGEKLSWKNLSWKGVAVVTICLGGFLLQI